ncbi:MAG: aminoglycoside phosphotransferase [Herbinix sp.]|jgi:kanamycin kinase/aminoglycoside 3'-phosphotransferase-3|nr:aminoglycoside phosphotransferase [Herbinix sp.]
MTMSELLLPDQIKNHIVGMEYEQINVGCSQAGVYKYYSAKEVYYLKVEPKSGELDKEYKNMLWLNGKLPVPRIIAWASEKDTDYLLMADMGGNMLCDDFYLGDPHLTVSLLAQGINLLRTVDIKDCPIQNGLHTKLKDAAENIRLNRVDMSDWETSSNGFSSPQDLLDYLYSNIPRKEELVFTHGDYCFPNIFADKDQLTGFIDLGRAGVADLWQDVALCLRSLWHNFNTKEYDELLLKQLNIPMDKEKLNYYILLDEMF